MVLSLSRVLLQAVWVVLACLAFAKCRETMTERRRGNTRVHGMNSQNRIRLRLLGREWQGLRAGQDGNGGGVGVGEGEGCLEGMSKAEQMSYLRARRDLQLRLRGGCEAVCTAQEAHVRDVPEWINEGCKIELVPNIGFKGTVGRDDSLESIASQDSASAMKSTTPIPGVSAPATSVYGDALMVGEELAGTVKVLTSEVIGNGTFGIVFEGRLDNGERVAVKRVLQDTRFRNRELSVMRSIKHPNIVRLINFFFTCRAARPDDVFLNLVMEYVPDTLHRLTKQYWRQKEKMPMVLVKVYAWQILRSLAYLHRLGVCHRDIKPQNVLVDASTHIVKLCDLGSAKRLTPGSTSISYICSRFYRAPELILGATEYTTAVDMWSFGCLLAEVLLGRPVFAGETSADQLVAIARVLGEPGKDSLVDMDVNVDLDKALDGTNRAARFDGWQSLARAKAPVEAVDLLSKVLTYSPKTRKTAIECLAHPFFDALRDPNTCLPDGSPLPPLFALTAEEVSASRELGMLDKLLPRGSLDKFQHNSALRESTPVTSPTTTPLASRAPSPGCWVAP